MGWTSTADALEHVGRANLRFGTAEEAVAFARRHGWEYELRTPHERRHTRAKRFLGYGDNFRYKAYSQTASNVSIVLFGFVVSCSCT